VLQLRTADDRVLTTVFGRYAARMRDKAHGMDPRPVGGHVADQSISAEETFDIDIADRDILRRHVGRLAQRVAERVRSKELQGSVVTVKIRRSDFATFTRQRRVSPPTANPANVAAVAGELLDRWLDQHDGARLRLLGVGLSGLSEATQLALFDAGARDVDRAVDSIRERFGEAAVVLGRALDRD